MQTLYHTLLPYKCFVMDKVCNRTFFFELPKAAVQQHKEKKTDNVWLIQGGKGQQKLIFKNSYVIGLWFKYCTLARN